MKTSIRIRVAVCLSVILTLFAPPTPASACSCLEGLTVRGEFTQREAVFTGKVVRVADNYFPIFWTIDSILFKLGIPPYFIREDRKLGGYSVFFKVIDSWKGVKKTIVEVDTGRGMGDCGYSFILHEEYLVYASHAYGIPENYWVTSICSRTGKSSMAADDLNFLSTLPSHSLQYAIPIMWTEQDLIILMLPLILATAVLLIGRRRQIQK